MGRRKKKRDMDLDQAMAMHRQMLVEAESDFKQAKDAARDFWEETVKPLQRAQERLGEERVEKMGRVDRSVIVKRERAQTLINKNKRLRRDLFKELHDAAAMQAKYKDGPAAAAWKQKEGEIRRAIAEKDEEISQAQADFRHYDEQLEELLADL